ncbi:MAG: PilZ domain-containing protein [Pelosinus sp.]|nr:PilZ domain-containing protein [Pelosinus sp.]
MNIFKVNQRFTIMLSKNTGSPQFQSRIEEVTSKHIVCAMPMIKGRPLIVQLGIKFYGKTIIDGVVYFFTCRLLDKKVFPLPVWIIDFPFDIQRIQQRSFVRVDAMLPVQVSSVDEEQQEDIETSAPLQVITKDISGGGAQLILHEPVKVGTRLALVIDVPDMPPIETIGEVIRVERPKNDRELFWIGIKFLDIQEAFRNKLIKFIFKKQLEQRQKGL